MTGTDRLIGRQSWPTAAKALMVLGLVAIVGLAARPSWAQAPPGKEYVADVIVEGNRNVSTDKIMRFIRTRPGSEFSYSALHEDVTRLMQTNMFRNVRPSEKRVTDERTGETKLNVYFIIQEYPTLVQEVIYKNAHHISQKDLDEMTRIRKGAPLDPTLNRTACFEIQDHLKKKGRFFASVVLEEGDKVGDTRVVFNITEGPVVRVGKVHFT